MTEKEQVSLYMRNLIRNIKPIKIACKYLSFQSGMAMLESNNIQFTQARCLNDPYDCSNATIDFSNICKYFNDVSTLNKEVSKIEQNWNSIRNWGICSLGDARNPCLWQRYSSKDGLEDGICIELDLQMVIEELSSEGHRFVALPINYVDSVYHRLPAEFFYLGDKVDKFSFFAELLSSKNRIDPDTSVNWQQENEIRLVSLIEQDKPKRCQLSPNCITKVYYGKNVNKERSKQIIQIVSSKYPKIKAIRNW